MDSFITEIIIILALIIVNGVLAMSEIALVASRRARLQQKADEGHPGAQVALDLANSSPRSRSASR
jgi:putative hemolysin